MRDSALTSRTLVLTFSAAELIDGLSGTLSRRARLTTVAGLSLAIMAADSPALATCVTTQMGPNAYTSCSDGSTLNTLRTGPITTYTVTRPDGQIQTGTETDLGGNTTVFDGPLFDGE